MKRQILFSGKIKEYISNCRLLKYLPSMLSVSGSPERLTRGWVSEDETAQVLTPREKRK